MGFEVTPASRPVFDRLTIVREVAAATKEQPAKTRAFSVTLAGQVTVDLPEVDPGTPVWLCYLGSEHASRAFSANIRGKFPAVRDAGGRIQIAPGLGHRWITQRVEDGAITTAYLPKLFHLEPMGPVTEDADDDRIRFVMMPSVTWLRAQATLLTETFGEDAEDAALGALFVAYLDRRLPLPILHDFGFHLRLFRAAQREGVLMAAGGHAMHAEGVEACGLVPPLLCSATPGELETFLVSETSAFVAAYAKKGLHHGSSGFRSDRRLLPNSFVPVAQLCFDLELPDVGSVDGDGDPARSLCG